MVISKICGWSNALRIVILAILLLAGGAGAATLMVDDSGGADYTRIQDAINNASAGDTILVYSGTYYENVNVTRQLILHGVDTGGGKPVVDANRSGSAITLSVGNSTLDGFTTVNTWYSNAGILVNSNNNIVRNNTAANNIIGIDLTGSSSNTLSGNNASNNHVGIFLYSSSNNTLSGNNVSNNGWGIKLHSSSNNTLSGNNALNSYWDGINLGDSSSNTLSGNNASNNGGNGIYLYFSSNNTLSGNNALNSWDGIALGSSSSNTLSGNNASNNRNYGISLSYSSSNNTLSGNNVSNNGGGIKLSSSSSNTLNGNNANSNKYGGGISLWYSNNNTLSGNDANSNNWKGIFLDSSINNTLNRNNALNNVDGISLSYSSNNTLSGNMMTGNTYNFDLYGASDSEFNNQIDTSNLVDGRPIYYIKNASDAIYDSSNNAGTFYCISCVNVTIKDMNLNKNGVGIFFWNTTNSRIQNITASDNYKNGIELRDSSSNTLSGNNASNNVNSGIALDYSSSNTLSGNNASNNEDGILLYSSSNNTLSGNNANSKNGIGIFLLSSSNNTLSGNNALNNGNGIDLGDSSSNTLSGNNASNNGGLGIYLVSSSSNTLSGNDANSNNWKGIYLYSSSNSTLSGNTMTGNTYNFDLYGASDSEFNNQIDTSNLVDGRPIDYIKNASDAIYDYSNNAGTLYCINCVNVTIKDMNLNKNGVGIFFWNTTNSRILNITASNNYKNGIELRDSSSNTLSGNNASNNGNYGIYLGSSSSSTLSGNIVNNNSWAGMALDYSSSNTIYNNFFHNSNNFIIINSVNIWNTTKTPGTNIISGPYLGGNFWANPSGTGFSQTCADGDGDGICDSPYTLDSNNIDYLPLTVTATTPDTTAPVITILGNNPETVIVGSTYIDAGATALDDVDGPVPVTNVSTVNTAVIGTYTVTYTATDAAGNTATATRTVYVVAPPLPKMFNISGYKINGADGTGISNWMIMLMNITTGSEIANTTTNGMGFYNFISIQNGTYLVTEEMKPGWMNTTPMSKMVTIDGMDAVNVNFTNEQKQIKINATVEIEPETLNLESKGVFTAFITLPDGFNVSDIDISTVTCNGARAVRGAISERDSGTLVVKFDRQDLNVFAGNEVALKVTGRLSSGVVFEGSDTIRIIDQG